MTLTKTERLILINQYRALAVMNPKEEKHYAEACEILENGYALEYTVLFQPISDELTEDECREVYDILDMYRALKAGYDKLDDKTGIDGRISFGGFDQNEETARYEYVRFLIVDQGRWEESNIPDLNSHWPMLESYRKMLREWHNSTDRMALTRDDVGRIISAQKITRL